MSLDDFSDDNVNFSSETASMQPPHAWSGILMGLVGVGVLCAAGVWMGIHYMTNRPVNLLATSRNAAMALERMLVDYGISEDNIDRPTEVHMGKGESTEWYAYRYRVDVPAQYSVAGVEELIQRNLGPQGVQVGALSFDGQHQGISLAIMDHVFAEVYLNQAGPVLTGLQDLRESSGRILEDIQLFLTANGLATEALHVYGPTEASNQKYLWQNAKIEAVVPADWDMDSIETRLRISMMRRDAEVVRDSSSRERQVFLVRHEGQTILELNLLTESRPPGLAEATVVEAALDAAQQVAFTPLDLAEVDDMALLREEGAEVRPKVALILDDGGHGGAVSETILGFQYKLTLAILPNAKHTLETAVEAAKLGFELMLHMPMENDSKTESYPGEILTTMDQEDILQLTADALDQVPGVAGVNNHTGSHFTSDEHAMRLFLEEMKERDLYFVDSFTTPTSIVPEVAKIVGVRSEQRDIFIDHLEHKQDPEYVRGMLRKMMKIAEEKGEVIAIGHFWTTTAEVLEEMLPEIAETMDFVFVSEVVE